MYELLRVYNKSIVGTNPTTGKWWEKKDSYTIWFIYQNNRGTRFPILDHISKPDLQNEFRVIWLDFKVICRESDNYDDQFDEEMRALQMIQQQKRQPIAKDVVNNIINQITCRMVWNWL